MGMSIDRNNKAGRRHGFLRLLAAALPCLAAALAALGEIGAQDDGGLAASAAAASPGASLTRAPYLQLISTQSATIRWRTDQAVQSVLRYGTNAAALDFALTNHTLATSHTLAAGNLSPDTRYYYSVET